LYEEYFIGSLRPGSDFRNIPLCQLDQKYGTSWRTFKTADGKPTNAITQMFLRRQAVALTVEERPETTLEEKISAVEVMRKAFSGDRYDLQWGHDLPRFASHLVAQRREKKNK
jgi:hypothetical protein